MYHNLHGSDGRTPRSTPTALSKTKNDRNVTYTVKRGDTLSKIASRHGVTLVGLLAVNPRYKADPNSISVGDKVEIPGRSLGSVKTVKKKPTKKEAPVRAAPAAPVDDPFTVAFGQLTFDA